MITSKLQNLDTAVAVVSSIVAVVVSGSVQNRCADQYLGLKPVTILV